jgi:hypothetical protein
VLIFLKGNNLSIRKSLAKKVQNIEVSDTETNPAEHNEDAVKYKSLSHKNFYN